MNPNLNNHMGIPHHHQGSHSSSQLQSSAPSLHSLHHTQLHTPHAHSHSHPTQAHLPPQYHLQQAPASEHLTTLRDSLDHHQVQQRTNIEHYKSSAQPAFRGYIETTHDALIIFNACYTGVCDKVTRRLHERERRSIDSGAVYVFDEAEAGIKRWTDGRMWSPSRILNNFLVYREIDQKRPTATANAASGVNASSTAVNPSHKHNDPSNNGNSMIPNDINLSDHPSSSTGSHHPSVPPRPVTPSCQAINSQHHQSPSQAEGSHSHGVSSLDSKPNIPQDCQDPPQSQAPSTSENQSQALSARRPMNRERERALVGSLTSTYKFRPDGLVKKTISLAGMHMISYYKMEDVLVGRLRTPKTHDELRQIPIHERFLQPAFFRVPPIWGYTDGILWVQDEGPEDSSQISSSNTSSPYHNGQRPGPQPLPKTQSIVSHSVQGVRGSVLQHHSNTSDRLLPSALSRPSSSSSSAGSTSATSPVSPNTLPLMAAPNLNSQAGPIGRVAVSANSSTRYEPYSRPPRSPPLAVSSTVTNSALTDQQSTVPYYAQNQSTSGVNGYSSNPFLSDSHSTTLVATERNTRPDPSNHNGRTLDSIGQVHYGDSGSYRTHTTTGGGGESIYAHYTSTDTTHNTNRSASVPPSPYGLPSITRLRVPGQPGSASSCNPDARGIGEYQFSASSNHQQVGRLSSPNLNHGGSYGAYLSPVPTEFRCHPGAPNLSGPGRENNHYTSSSQPPGTLSNAPGQTSSVSGTQSPTFLYPSPPTSTAGASFSSTYPFSTNMINQQPQGGNTSRRGSGVATLGSELDRDSADLNGGGTRINALNRISGGAPQRNENENTASSHWGQINSSHTMKTEEGSSAHWGQISSSHTMKTEEGSSG